jgi:hypothetical protein
LPTNIFFSIRVLSYCRGMKSKTRQWPGRRAQEVYVTRGRTSCSVP